MEPEAILWAPCPVSGSRARRRKESARRTRSCRSGLVLVGGWRGGRSRWTGRCWRLDETSRDEMRCGFFLSCVGSTLVSGVSFWGSFRFCHIDDAPTSSRPRQAGLVLWYLLGFACRGFGQGDCVDGCNSVMRYQCWIYCSRWRWRMPALPVRLDGVSFHALWWAEEETGIVSLNRDHRKRGSIFCSGCFP